MKNEYKIYYNDSYVLLSTKAQQINNNFSKVITDNTHGTDLFGLENFLFEENHKENMLIVSDKPGHIMCDLLEHVEVIVAGGGLVWNENEELLMIHRRGKWDLPKGKIELKEDIKDGAVREVEEETGVKVLSTEERAIITYHAYVLKGKKCIKHTAWYTMTAKPNQSTLTPQTEEDIEEARWVKKADLKNYRDICYPLIWDLIAPYSASV